MNTPNTGRRRPTLAECTAAANRRLAKFKSTWYEIAKCADSSMTNEMYRRGNSRYSPMLSRKPGMISARLGK